MAQISATMGRDARVIALVSIPHLLSHAYFLVLPPLFPLLKVAFGVSYMELGFALTLFGIAAGLGQVPVGFLVDKIGGAPLLIGGLALQGAAIALIGTADAYWQLLVLCVFAGLAHTVYHPADYAILTARVDQSRLGRAYGIHSFSGNIGFAIAPVFMVTVAELWHWRAAFLAIGIVGLAFSLFLMARRSDLASGSSEDRPSRSGRRMKPARDEGQGTRAGLRLLISAPILMCFLFFVVQMAGIGGLRAFLVAALDQLFATPLAVVNTALFGLLAGSAVGILVGADLADRWGPRIGTALLTLGPAAALIVLIGTVPMSLVALTAALTAVGFLQGMLLPSRDLLLRSVTPDGSMGKVMGFVSSGGNLSGGLVPLVYGFVLDVADPAWIFWISAGLVAAALLTFLTVRGQYGR
jgi:FSR family fosmidomycin resistance protein-like MFS transporter